MKRILSLVLSLALVIGLLPTGALAEGNVVASGEVAEEVTWSLTSDGTLTISGNGAIPDGSRPWSSHGSAIKIVIIENGITSVGNTLFAGCYNIEEITTPMIPSYFLYGESHIYSGIQELYYHWNNATNFWSGNQLRKVTITGDRPIGVYAFYRSPVQEVVIEGKVETIGGSAFSACSALQRVVLPNTLTTVGDSAFSACGALTTISFPDSVTSVGTFALSGTGLSTPVTMGQLTAIPTGTYYNCPNITTLAGIPRNFKSIGAQAFRSCTSLTVIEGLPETITSIGNEAFAGCTNLTKAVFPNSLTSLGVTVFSGCTKLEELSLPFMLGATNQSRVGGLKSLFTTVFPDYDITGDKYD